MKNLYRVVGWVLIIIVLSVSSGYLVNALATSVNNDNRITIVIDAGHGGRDGGCIGANGTIEKNINLDYAKRLANKLKTSGYNVIMTRENDDGLYDLFAKNKKVSDMNNRLQIIKKAQPNLIISIHMNSFADSSASGCEVYHKIDDEASETVSKLIAKSLVEYCDVEPFETRAGDYYMLNCSYYTSVLVECGFLSNPGEEMLLNSEDYKTKFVDAVAMSIGMYFGIIAE